MLVPCQSQKGKFNCAWLEFGTMIARKFEAMIERKKIDGKIKMTNLNTPETGGSNPSLYWYQENNKLPGSPPFLFYMGTF